MAPFDNAPEGSLQFWVIGGEFEDTSFRRLADGRAEALGPFDSYDDAFRTWRQRSDRTRSAAHVRYTITANPAG